jgi:hypothetical protein
VADRHGCPDVDLLGLRAAARPPNNAMQLTKLRAAPELRAEVPPCAPAGESDGGTASQLIASVRRQSVVWVT